MSPELTMATIATEILTLSEKLMSKAKKAITQKVCRAPHPKIDCFSKITDVFLTTLKRIALFLLFHGILHPD